MAIGEHTAMSTKQKGPSPESKRYAELKGNVVGVSFPVEGSAGLSGTLVWVDMHTFGLIDVTTGKELMIFKMPGMVIELI